MIVRVYNELNTPASKQKDLKKKKQKVEVQNDPSYRWRMDKQPEAIYIISLFFWLDISTQTRRKFTNKSEKNEGIKKRKKEKNLASDAKNLSPAIINPIISLLTFFKFYILVTCLSTPRPRHSFSLSLN